MNVIERLRAADPVPDRDPITEADLAAVVTAARNARPKGRTTPRRPVSRRLLLGGIGGLAATAAGVAVGPSLLTRQDSAFAGPLRTLAHDVAAAPPPDADVLYAKWRQKAVLTMHLEPGLDPIRTRTDATVEEWHPLWPHEYEPVQLSHGTSEYLTASDAERGARLTPEQRRSTHLPPEGTRWTQRGVPLESRTGRPASFTEPTAAFVRDLPPDPATLKAMIEDDPVFDWTRGGSFTWWDRLVRWDEAKDEQLGYIVLELLRFVPTPRPVRVALIELLAHVRSIVVYGNRTIGGRSGVAVGFDGDPPTQAMVIDLETGLAINRNLLALDYVPAVGERP